MQVLLTKHKSKNFSNILFLLIPLLVTAMQKVTSKHLKIYHSFMEDSNLVFFSWFA